MSLSPGRSVSGPDDYMMFVGTDSPIELVGTPEGRLVYAASHSGRYHVDRERRGEGVRLEQWGIQIKGLSNLDSCSDGQITE